MLGKCVVPSAQMTASSASFSLPAMDRVVVTAVTLDGLILLLTMNRLAPAYIRIALLGLPLPLLIATP